MVVVQGQDESSRFLISLAPSAAFQMYRFQIPLVGDANTFKTVEAIPDENRTLVITVDRSTKMAPDLWEYKDGAGNVMNAIQIGSPQKDDSATETSAQ